MKRIRMAGWVGAIVCLSALALAPTSQAATELPRCPPRSLELFAKVPDYVQAGVGIDVLLLAEGNASNVALTVSSAAGEVTTPVALVGERTPLILGGVSSPDLDAQLILEWDQDVGMATACHGRYSHDLPVLPRGATAGVRSLPRFSGRFRIKTPLNPVRGWKTQWLSWSFEPYCDYFACDVRLRSTHGLDLRLRLTGLGRYRVDLKNPPTDPCAEDHGQGKVVAKKAYFSRQRLELRVTEERDDRVLAFQGKLTTTWEATRRARRLGCRKRDRESEAFGGRLVQSG